MSLSTAEIEALAAVLAPMVARELAGMLGTFRPDPLPVEKPIQGSYLARRQAALDAAAMKGVYPRRRL